MQAIILAAGMGKRLKKLTQNNTKCMVKVNGVTLAERLLRQLDARNLSRIVLVVGYQRQALMDYIATLNIHTPVKFIENPIYDTTNNIYSLSLAKELLCEEDTLLFESDLIFEDSVLDMLLDDPRKTLALVDKFESWMDGTCVKLLPNDAISAFIPGKQCRFSDKDEYYKTVNIYKFSREFSRNVYVPFLGAYQTAMGQNEYYEQVLRIVTMLGNTELRAKRLSGQKWYEIDDVQDLDIAESLFAPTSKERAERIIRRYGGYWRYPKMLDFCYLVNPYFPTERMMDEMRSNFDTLLTQYPSGMQVNSMLAAKMFDLPHEYITVGNGAAELIKELMLRRSGKTGFIWPTFEEYPNRYPPENRVLYTPEKPDYAYTADDVMRFFEGRDIRSLVLINPDNPSGNYIPRADVLRMADWAEKKAIGLVVDESFADFAEEENATLLTQDVLERYPRLVVVKSISKSYGVPGLRLGVLASGDAAEIAALKKETAIWNINSFAEYFMQIIGKYQNDYRESLRKLREERTRFAAALDAIDGIRVLPSQANYLMVALTKNVEGSRLLGTLLTEYNILIKDLAAKTGGGRYLRLAVRTPEDNDRLLAALREEMGKI